MPYSTSQHNEDEEVSKKCCSDTQDFHSAHNLCFTLTFYAEFPSKSIFGQLDIKLLPQYPEYICIQLLTFPCDNNIGSQRLHVAVDRYQILAIKRISCVYERGSMYPEGTIRLGGGGHIAIRQLLASHIHVPWWIHTNFFCIEC